MLFKMSVSCAGTSGAAVLPAVLTHLTPEVEAAFSWAH